jgi:hypothetical protein
MGHLLGGRSRRWNSFASQLAQLETVTTVPFLVTRGHFYTASIGALKQD